ncbi:50S ribosomal protein L15 [Candidatus Gottesmanbacteria bacterium RBG_13_37_7]|uniref:Large ribosomal subunit protein uL15 n=1 Tax=Candidatus Gottesmanbacteria bacterium RBG_13_37_7 TaxID=1798369 RepID=A0A1F5YIW4_9BACT|nr:MAG: 50S ribosomal protein L15 [Candidatus Gottesmanbacteria bacterium RBG_13_37_7]
MIQLNKLPKLIKSEKKRLGQGHGSGRGKTAGRGTKGQRSRGKIPHQIGILGVSLVRRLPLYRGKYKNKPKAGKPLPINIKFLNIIPKNSVVDLNFLIARKIIDQKAALDFGVKILGDGELEVPLTVKLPCSKNAKRKIESAGGKVSS